MRRRALGAAIASLALFTAACSGAAEDTVESAVGEASEAAGDAAGEASEAAGDAAGEASEAAGDAAGGSTVLTAMVGTTDDPEAFEITLMDESGEEVTELPAGDYTIEVTDPAETHNFHLTGGSVDETTSVPETVETTWEVTLEPGEYTYKCDPHPPMTGSFTVT
jgi:plastocyanin